LNVHSGELKKLEGARRRSVKEVLGGKVRRRRPKQEIGRTPRIISIEELEGKVRLESSKGELRGRIQKRRSKPERVLF